MLKFQLYTELFYISLDMEIIFLCVIISSNFFIFKEIRSRLTQFDYKGNSFEEDQLDDGCDQKICVCSQGTVKRCGVEAEAICFPNLGSTDARAHHQGSGIGRILYMCTRITIALSFHLILKTFLEFITL